MVVALLFPAVVGKVLPPAVAVELKRPLFGVVELNRPPAAVVEAVCVLDDANRPPEGDGAAGGGGPEVTPPNKPGP